MRNYCKWEFRNISQVNEHLALENGLLILLVEELVVNCMWHCRYSICLSVQTVETIENEI